MLSCKSGFGGLLTGSARWMKCIPSDGFSGKKRYLRVSGILGPGIQSATLFFYKLLNMNYITKMIVRMEDAVHRQFLDVDFEVLAIGQESMVTKMLYI